MHLLESRIQILHSNRVLAWISHTIFQRLIAFAGIFPLVKRSCGSAAPGAARGAGTFAGCGGSEHGLSVGLEMMPLMWRAAAARVRPASRGHRPRR